MSVPASIQFILVTNVLIAGADLHNGLGQTLITCVSYSSDIESYPTHRLCPTRNFFKTIKGHKSAIQQFPRGIFAALIFLKKPEFCVRSGVEYREDRSPYNLTF